jgi:putative endonuclease
MDSISDSDSEDAGSIPAGVTWFVYVLQSEIDSTFYVGMSQNISKRLIEHNKGRSKYTSGHLPWKLVYSEEAGTAENARKRERYFKSAAGKKHLHKILDAAGSLPA